MPSRHITIVGSLNTDLVSVTDRIPEGGETLSSHSFSVLPGGKGANSAAAASRLSHRRPAAEHGDTDASSDETDISVRMIGCVGDDPFGQPLIDALVGSKVDTSGVCIIPGQSTGTAVIIVEVDKGENRILISPGANHHLQPQDVADLSYLVENSKRPTPDLVVAQLELRKETVAQALQTAREAGIETLLNPAPASELPAEVYKMVTHLILNETEAAILTGRREEELNGEEAWRNAVNWFLERGVENVVLTLGSKGAYYANETGDYGQVKAQQGVKVVDTTGAGDTFVGAYAVHAVRSSAAEKWGLREVVQFGCRASALQIQKKGALEAIPWADELETPPGR